MLPRAVVDTAAERSLLVDYLTPRALRLRGDPRDLPGSRPEHVHVWTLGGKSREAPDRDRCGPSGARSGCTWSRTAGPAPQRDGGIHRVGDLRADLRGRAVTGDRMASCTSSSATGTRPPPRRSRRRASTRSSAPRPRCACSPPASRSPGSASATSCASTPRTASSRPGSPKCWAGRRGATDVDAYRSCTTPRPTRGYAGAADAPSPQTTSSPRRSGTGSPWPASCSPIPTPAAPGSRRSPRASTVCVTVAASERGVLRVTLTLRLVESIDREPTGLLAAARPLLRRPGLPHAPGEDLRLGADPQRAPDLVLRGARVPRRRRHPGPPRPGRRRGPAARQARASSATCSSGTRPTTRSGSAGSR